MLQVALLRGINVGGRNKLPMADLVALFRSLGCDPVRHYIQSGNIVFGAPKPWGRAEVAALRAAIAAAHGFSPPVLVIKDAAIRQALARNPFPAAEGNRLSYFFLETAPTAPDRKRLDALKASTEAWALVGQVFYLHAPDGFADSKLGAGAEAALGVTATARNGNTVARLVQMLDDLTS
ncbi:MAG TPA: DUF1697 domain-containing protein [Candidatus Krumholzibacteria bacterium]|nr:DUF1697 domain-containing protein [Candidatus Krumholzibacteria bacterium]